MTWYAVVYTGEYSGTRAINLGCNAEYVDHQITDDIRVAQKAVEWQKRVVPHIKYKIVEVVFKEIG